LYQVVFVADIYLRSNNKTFSVHDCCKKWRC